jgi:hypothetical protein
MPENTGKIISCQLPRPEGRGLLAVRDKGMLDGFFRIQIVSVIIYPTLDHVIASFPI